MKNERSYIDYETRYNILADEYEKYQKLMETRYQECIADSELYRCMTDSLNSVVTISTFLNDLVDSENFFSEVNDMLVGLLGIEHCSIFIAVNRTFILKATNKKENAFEHVSKLEYNSEYKVENIDGKIIVYMPMRCKRQFLGHIVAENRTVLTEKSKNKFQYFELLTNQISMFLLNNKLHAELVALANIDAVTGIFNRRYFYSEVPSKLSSQLGYIIIMADIDHFKKVNDTYGHQTGDAVLKTVATLLTTSMRKDDIASRYGGEEFVIFLHGICDKDIAYSKVDSMREKIQNYEFISDGKSFNITASFGVSIYGSESDNFEQLISIADNKLYESKANGRNKVTI